jgi:hypothetical protein
VKQDTLFRDEDDLVAGACARAERAELGTAGRRVAISTTAPIVGEVRLDQLHVLELRRDPRGTEGPEFLQEPARPSRASSVGLLPVVGTIIAPSAKGPARRSPCSGWKWGDSSEEEGEPHRCEFLGRADGRSPAVAWSHAGVDDEGISPRARDDADVRDERNAVRPG